MARRAAPQVIIEPEDDPVNDALSADASSGGAELLETLDELRSAGSSNIDILVYRLGKGGVRGSWDYCTTVVPPIEITDLMSSLKDEYGAGDYGLRIRVDRKLKTTKYISIAAGNIKPPEKNVFGDGNMLQFMMMQQSEARREQADMQRFMMQQQQASSDRMMQLLGALAPAAIAAFTGGKDKTSEVMAALGPYINRQEGDSTEKTLAMLKTAKELFGGDSPKDGDDTQELISNGVKLIGPGLKAIGDMVSRGRGQPAALPAADGGERVAADTGALMLGAPEFRPSPATIPAGAPLEYAARDPSKYPVLDLIRQDVLFLYGRGHDPEKAADLVYDTIDAHEVPEDDINALAAAFAISPDWLADLAAEGIDLRERPEWAQAFLGALLNIHANLDAEDERSGGREGGLPDAGKDGEAGEAGPARSADT
jgi:hypothetical protein